MRLRLRKSVVFRSSSSGRRSLARAPVPFQDGAAYIAIRAGIPIVPVALSGTGRLLPWVRFG
jgi:1-acyl-sn-glycerol-3-phosphate acyltransferase